MAEDKGPLAAAQEHLGTAEQDEARRREYVLDQTQIDALADARNAPKNKRVELENAFWIAAADRMGFANTTVDTDDETAVSGRFTAWPFDADTAVDEDAIDLSEGAHRHAIERTENLAREAVLTNKTLIVDVRDFIVDQIKFRPRLWSQTSNAEQRDVFSAAEFAAEELVRKIVEALASQPGTEPIRALLVSYSDKGEITAQLKVKAFTPAEQEAAVLGLHRAVGKHVLVAVASKDDYADPRDPELDQDEPGLRFDADSAAD